MNSLVRAAGVTLVVGFSLGCGGGHSINVVRMGAVYEAKPATCDITFENMPMDEAMQKYEMLGQLLVMGADSLTPEVKRDVVAEACKLGADAVILNVSVSDNMQFMPMRSK